MMERKGISPLIAAVLLIAFTMAVASLFAQWAPQLLQDAQGDTSNQSAEIQRCSDIIVEVNNHDFGGSVASVTVQQTTGEDAAGNVSITWDMDNAVYQNFTSISNNREAKEVSINKQGGNVDEVRLNPINCEGAATQTFKP